MLHDRNSKGREKTFSDMCIMENMYQFKRCKKENRSENDPKSTQVECHLQNEKKRNVHQSSQHKNKNWLSMTQRKQQSGVSSSKR